jgi:hypothetical protein
VGRSETLEESKLNVVLCRFSRGVYQDDVALQLALAFIVVVWELPLEAVQLGGLTHPGIAKNYSRMW